MPTHEHACIRCPMLRVDPQQLHRLQAITENLTERITEAEYAVMEALWARHPRVFLDVTHDGKASCPYCGAKYVFAGELPKGHH